MKTITLTDEQYDFLQKLGKRMSEQSNRATQYPLFCIEEEIKAYGDKEWCNEAERREESNGGLCDACEYKENNNEDLPDYCDDCDESCFVWFNWEKRINTDDGSFFLTEEAVESHIALNDHHYREPRSYVISAWRNPEIQELMRTVFSIAGIEVPSCYK